MPIHESPFERLDAALLICGMFVTLPSCSSDLDLNLNGRACRNGACLRGFECVDAVCVPEGSASKAAERPKDADSDSPMAPPAVTDAGDDMMRKRDSSAQPVGTGTGGEPPKELDAGAPPGPRDAASVTPVDAAADSSEMSSTGRGDRDAGPCPGLEQCGETCVDLATDPRHCGGCGRACATVERCAGGTCQAECGAVEPARAQDCPEVCDSCSAGACHISCGSEQECKERKIKCPDGFGCVIACSAKQACEKVAVACAANQLCSIRCAGEQACKGARVTCETARCEMLCESGTQSCEDANLRCGAGAPCRATCAAGQTGPAIRDCVSSCSNACACD